MTRPLVPVWLVAGVIVLSASASAQDLASKGKDVYSAQKCGVCHSIAGVGNKRGALDGVGSKLTAADIRAWIADAPAMTAKAKAERKPAMKAYTLAKDDLDALVVYLQTLK
jgi:mono/diheme cytochrome c family protein